MNNISHQSNSAVVKRKPVPEVESHRYDEFNKITTQAHAITQEILRPQVHEIQHQQVHREIHTHDVIHRVQPIRHVEVLPAKHYVQNADGNLVEVSKANLS